MDAFIFSVTVTASETVTLPLINTYVDGGGVTRTASYDFIAIWGDGTANSKVTTYNDSDRVHTYTNAGTYWIKIKGVCQGFSCYSQVAIRAQIRKVIKWGTVADFRYLNFYNCVNLTALPTGAITGASNITTFIYFLSGCTSYTSTLDEDWFSLTPSVASFNNSFSYSGITGNVPTLLFSYAGANVLDFQETFRNTNLGNSSETLPDDIFDTNVNATTFYATFYATKYTCEIPLLFTQNVDAVNFSYTFAGTPFKGTIPETLFDAAGTSAKYFTSTFDSTNITGIPDHLFWNNTEALWFDATFARCYGLYAGNDSLGYEVFNDNLFSQNTKVTTFAQTFWLCENLNIPLSEYMFKYNDANRSFYGTFAKVPIDGGIPRKLFWNSTETNTSVTNMSYTFYQAGSASWYLTGDLDPDLFMYQTEVTTYAYCFRWRLGITKAPNGLFRNNLKVTSFFRTFEVCYSMKLERYVFSAPDPDDSGDTDEDAAYRRFTGKTMDFRYAFYLNTYGGGDNTRYAPELWDSTIYDMVGSSYTDCFNYNSGDPYSNDSAIPAGWL
jgi:hypothetical protein